MEIEDELISEPGEYEWAGNTEGSSRYLLRACCGCTFGGGGVELLLAGGPVAVNSGLAASDCSLHVVLVLYHTFGEFRLLLLRPDG